MLARFNGLAGRCFRPTARCSERATALNESYENHDDSDHEQDVNEAANGDAGDEAEQPKDDENDGDSV